MADLAKNILHQSLVFAKIKTDTGKESGPDNRTETTEKHKFPERHMAHASRNTNQ